MQNKYFAIHAMSVLLLFSACLSSKPSIGTSSDIISGSKTLYDYKWKVSELQGHGYPTKNDEVPYLLLTSNHPNKVLGFTGCNKLSGSFILSGSNGIKFSAIVTTRMACANNNKEAGLLEAIAQTDNWIIINQMLFLNKGKKTLIKLTGIIF